jgi:hypothetical protein
MSQLHYSKKEQTVGIIAIMVAAWVVQLLYNLYLQPKGMYVTFLEVVGIFCIFMMIVAMVRSK